MQRSKSTGFDTVEVKAIYRPHWTFSDFNVRICRRSGQIRHKTN